MGHDFDVAVQFVQTLAVLKQPRSRVRLLQSMLQRGDWMFNTFYVALIGFGIFRAEEPDGFRQGVEDRGSRDVLDHVFPPALRVVVTGCRGQVADRVGA